MPADPEADRRLLARLGLADAAERDPRDLSGGEQQRAALAPSWWPIRRSSCWTSRRAGSTMSRSTRWPRLLPELKAEGRTIIMATHDVELAAACADRVVLMAEGQIVVDGPAREVMSDSQVFSSQINKLFRDPRYLVVEDVPVQRWVT